jgi:cold shock protein
VQSGAILWFNNDKGYGFLLPDGGEQMFFHISGFSGDERDIEKNLKITFDIGEGRDGRPCAVNVRPANAAMALAFGDR